MDKNIKLKVMIFKSGKSQKEIAKILGIHDTRLSEFVNGWKVPPDEIKNKFAKLLNCKVVDIF